MQAGETTGTYDLLKRNGIPFEQDRSHGMELLVLHATQTEPSSLRRLGFRLGHGLGEIQYLIYFRGRFCGVVM